MSEVTDTTTDEPTPDQSDDTDVTDADRTPQQTTDDDGWIESKLDAIRTKVRETRDALATSYDDMVARCEERRKYHYECVTTNAQDHSNTELVSEWIKLGGVAYMEGFSRLLRWTYESGRDGTVSLFRLVAGTTAIFAYAVPVTMLYGAVIRPAAEIVAERVAKGAAKRAAKSGAVLVRNNLPLIIGAVVVAGLAHYLYKRYSDDDDEATTERATDSTADLTTYDVTLDIVEDGDEDNTITMNYTLDAADRADAIQQAKREATNDILNFENRTIKHSAAYPAESDDGTQKTYEITARFTRANGPGIEEIDYEIEAPNQRDAIDEARSRAKDEIDDFAERIITFRTPTVSSMGDKSDTEEELATDGGNTDELQDAFTFDNGGGAE